MAAAKYSLIHTHISQEFCTSTTRKSGGCFRLSSKKADFSVSDAKRANLSARKKERIKLPNYGDGVGGNRSYHISEFFSHPSGIEAMLNSRALKSYQPLDSNLYRCVLPQIQLLSFRVAPVLDLQVTPTTEDCVVEMLSCKFEGSEAVERQNERFSASMRNHIKWETVDAEHVLDVDVELNILLEINTQPFALLPISAVERPGNLVMQALVDQLVPLLAQQLLQDYKEWIRQQSKCLE
ncbi:uncharacterized protein LOC131014988 [Salvia miltiorrhiza]|uniref:uncharacterized protein LOC131014988 n=1 Tax=Salvia miltiorrhiza TaxID=226208 RepID=UPI0025ACD3BD|nr:uncharacterized protein LOC131014988 [Salvia miltiorrhiza]XP_057799154.1 uncharacterized protein LOC131014988 [Salvia miltiorrhiza]XP_057799155.1 uncharacterized protein LOC131014988 [Salvia miltiorrhiza]XP_057799156.1 uncharacterized protein LOC131014988 [Salvia miltiorrhiza]